MICLIIKSVYVGKRLARDKRARIVSVVAVIVCLDSRSRDRDLTRVIALSVMEFIAFTLNNYVLTYVKPLVYAAVLNDYSDNTCIIDKVESVAVDERRIDDSLNGNGSVQLRVDSALNSTAVNIELNDDE